MLGGHMNENLEFFDESALELAEMDQTIKMFTESALDLIENMEQAECVRATYFTEAADESEKMAQNKANKNIFKTIAESISKIFSKLASIVSKGKVKAKSVAQAKVIKTVGEKVKEFPDVKIKIQDVWKFSNFADKTIDTYVRKFDKKNISTFEKVVGGKKKAIEQLTSNLNELASAMKSPANKKFTISGGKVNAKSVAKAAAILVGGEAILRKTTTKISGGSGSTEELDNTPKIPMHGRRIATTELGYKAKNDTGRASKLNKTKSTELSGSTFTFGPTGGTFTNIARITITLAAIATVFSGCPKTIGTETVTLKELYKRLTELEPSKFPSIIAGDAKTVNSYMQRSETMMEFAKTSDGSKGAVKYSQEISALLSAYTNFHQSLIDFYLNIITSVLKAGGVSSSKKIYTAESVQDDQYDDECSYTTESEDGAEHYEYNDDDNVEIENKDDYTESQVYNETDFMDLDSFIESSLTDMEC